METHHWEFKNDTIRTKGFEEKGLVQYAVIAATPGNAVTMFRH